MYILFLWYLAVAPSPLYIKIIQALGIFKQQNLSKINPFETFEEIHDIVFANFSNRTAWFLQRTVLKYLCRLGWFSVIFPSQGQWFCTCFPFIPGGLPRENGWNHRTITLVLPRWLSMNAISNYNMVSTGLWFFQGLGKMG